MLPSAPFTVPAPPVDSLTSYRGRHLKIVARILLDWPSPLPGWLARTYQQVRPALAECFRASPGAFYSALSLPTVAAPACGADLLAAVPQLLVELARQRALPEGGVFWGAPVSRLVVPALAVARRFESPRVGMLFGNGVVTVSPTEEWVLAPGEGGAWPLAEGGWLLGADTNPLAMMELHPDKSGNALDFGQATPAEWVASIDRARARVARYLPALAAEHRTLLAGIVPVGQHGEKSLSASYKEAIGLAYLSLHPSSLTMTEALVHEVQHTKANLLSWSDPLVENSDERYPSPVRPDPRPLWGVLLAVHAFLPVALIHRAMYQSGDPEHDPGRYREVLQVNHDGMEVLRAHARPTPLGRQLVDGMDALEAAFWAEANG
ncbi:MAG: hypothetical protein FJ090_14420 [Deltaproteobacteria bacterium]|nr:hypothetical protein [Deltaproteobacteria bacterium]